MIFCIIDLKMMKQPANGCHRQPDCHVCDCAYVKIKNVLRKWKLLSDHEKATLNQLNFDFVENLQTQEKL